MSPIVSHISRLQVEEGLCDGAVLYHAHVSRSKAEVAAQKAAKDEAAKLKAARRQQQEENVRRKQVRWSPYLLPQPRLQRV